MISDCLSYPMTKNGLHFWALLCEKQLVCEKAASFSLDSDIFTINKSIVDKLDYEY